MKRKKEENWDANQANRCWNMREQGRKIIKYSKYFIYKKVKQETGGKKKKEEEEEENWLDLKLNKPWNMRKSFEKWRRRRKRKKKEK